MSTLCVSIQTLLCSSAEDVHSDHQTPNQLALSLSKTYVSPTHMEINDTETSC